MDSQDQCQRPRTDYFGQQASGCVHNSRRTYREEEEQEYGDKGGRLTTVRRRFKTL